MAPPTNTNGPSRAQANPKPNGNTHGEEADGDTDNDYDPLFDDEGDGEAASSANPASAPQSAVLPSQSNGVPPANASSAQTPFQLPGTNVPVANGFQQHGSFRLPAKNSTPVLDPVTYHDFSPDIFMTSGIDGQITLWDRRTSASGRGLGRLDLPEKTPPWCISVRLPSVYPPHEYQLNGIMPR